MERAKSNVGREVYQHTQSLFYKDSPYRIPIIGYKDVFMGITSSDLKAYYDLTYVPENMVVVVGGSISENAIVSDVKKTFGALPAKAAPLRYHANERRIISPAHSTVVIDALASQRVIIRYPIVSFYHDDVYPLDLLAYIFGNGQQSLFYQEFVVEQALATSVRVSSITPTYDFGYFEVALETTEDSERVIRKVQEFIDTFRWRRIEKSRIQKPSLKRKRSTFLGKIRWINTLKKLAKP